MTRRSLLSLISLLAFGLTVSTTADVLQHHLHATRDGLYVDPLLTQDAAAATHRDFSFNASFTGVVNAQPLYVANGPQGRATFIVATEQNDVLAIDAGDGSQLWSVHLADPAPRGAVCGNIDPLGITGTPVVDPVSRLIYLDAMTTSPDDGRRQHKIHALSLDDGSTPDGWPVDVNGLMSAGGIPFVSTYQNQRGALLLNGGYLYVPYGGHLGDCGDYHGWVVAVPVGDPNSATAFATDATGGGIWAPSGLASDGTSVYAATGNTFGASEWMGGEAIIRLGPGATFSGAPADYFAPTNWQDLDRSDLDLGGVGPLVVDVPGATPSQLIVALGKDGIAYLLDRNYLGGIGGQAFSARVATGQTRIAAASYTTPSGTYVVFAGGGLGVGCPAAAGDLVAFRIEPGSPPTVRVVWCAANNGRGSPIVTTTDGSSNAIVWTIGAEGTNRLYAYNGETGETLFNGGGPDEQMATIRHFLTPIATGGRIIVAGDNQLYAFTTQ